MPTPKCRDKETTIAYRLGRPYTDRLEKSAQDHGISRGQYARLALVMHFEETAMHRLAEEVSELKREVTDLRLEQAMLRRSACGKEGCLCSQSD